ncbi:MAG: BatD family protein [Acetobacteraceae bacterium]|nr:BatD family protein [Acetobacteraceae bacterium]
MIRAPGLAVLLWAWGASAQSQEVLVQTSRQPEGTVMLGQPVRLFVDVLFAGPMQHPPRVAEPNVAGAQVLRFETQATGIADRINGKAYSGQRFEFDLYARRAGTLTIPPTQVALLDRSGDPVGTATGSPMTVQAVVPPGLDPSGPIVASDRVTLRERWNPQVKSELQVGDALTREIERTAEDVPGLALAPPAFTAPDGVRVYTDTPAIEDRVERGAVTGERTDRVTYLFEKPGTYLLPGIQQPWWNLRTRSAATLSTSPFTVRVAGVAAKKGSNPGRFWPPVAGLLAILGAAVLVLRKQLRGMLNGWRAQSHSSEALALRELLAACRGTDSIRTYRALQAWNAARPDGVRCPALATSISGLERCIFGAQSAWTPTDAAKLHAAVANARRTRPAIQDQDALPPLNPV